MSPSHVQAVAALAGRRIDQLESATIQFPLSNVSTVQARLHTLFEASRFTNLVCSAACGADLIAAENAKLLGMTIDIILPYSPSKFRQTSVIDRPGDWGSKYDELIADCAAQNRLHILASDEEGTYDLATAGILDLVRSMVPVDQASGVVVWEGRPKNRDDATLDFKQRAEHLGMRIHEVPTC